MPLLPLTLLRPWLRRSVGNIFVVWIGILYGNVPYTPLASHIGRPMQLEGSHSPGPRYSVGTNSCGRQLLSSARSQPSGAFARANRFVDLKDAANTPGPGEYVV